jgi:hypothetical protein
LDQGFEDGVDPAEDGWDGAEVGGEGDGFAEEVLGGEVRRDVGAAEAVDRLLRVADNEQAALWNLDVAPVLRVGFGTACDPDGELDLDRVGVLELVEQEPLEAFCSAARTLGACAGGRERDEEVVGTPGVPLPDGFRADSSTALGDPV